jgi:hypothetical protein
MNKILRISVISLTAALFFLAGCKSLPVYNIKSAPINTSAKHSAKAIKQSIMQAGISYGWNMKEKKSGHIVATLFKGKILAIIDIRYNKNSYSITYKKSKGLLYDGSSIHKRYNGWIRNLDNAIQAQLTIL